MNKHLIYIVLTLSISCSDSNTDKDTSNYQVTHLSSPNPGLSRVIVISDTMKLVFSQPFATCECQDIDLVDTLWNELGLLTRQGYFLVDSSRHLFVIPGHGEVSPTRDSYGFFYNWMPGYATMDSLPLLRGKQISSSQGSIAVSFIDLRQREWGLYFSNDLNGLSDNGASNHSAEDYNIDGSIRDGAGISYFLLSVLIARDRAWMNTHKKSISKARLEKYKEIITSLTESNRYHADLRKLIEQGSLYK